MFSDSVTAWLNVGSWSDKNRMKAHNSCWDLLTFVKAAITASLSNYYCSGVSQKWEYHFKITMFVSFLLRQISALIKTWKSSIGVDESACHGRGVSLLSCYFTRSDGVTDVEDSKGCGETGNHCSTLKMLFWKAEFGSPHRRDLV